MEPSGCGCGRSPLDLRLDAARLVAEAATIATVHGDMNLRNVLVRDGREPFLIDYAYSGPGHPCFDLVRFESALMFQMFRMTDEDPACATSCWPSIKTALAWNPLPAISHRYVQA